MTSFKEERQHAILELFYNKKHKRGHSIVENNGILKKTFKVLMQKSSLHVKFLLNVFMCCY
jgi:site-specific DNA-adenine methylase